MAQVDILNYFPLLIWFFIIFIFYYFIIFCYIIPIFFSSLTVRKLFLIELLVNIFNFELFFSIFFKYCYNSILIVLLVNIFKFLRIFILFIFIGYDKLIK